MIGTDMFFCCCGEVDVCCDCDCGNDRGEDV